MIYVYNGTPIYYKFYGSVSTSPIIFLHGWARTGEDFEKIISLFPERSFLTIDLPPFGKSGNIEGYNIFTYVSMIISLCEHLNISSCDIIGHSFGGRLALIMASTNASLVHSCILIDSAGMKPRRSLKYYISRFLYRFRRFFHLDTSNYGSKDYKALSPDMKACFNSIVNLHLEDYAKRINQNVLLIWGQNDRETPLYMAKRLHRKIKHSSLEIVSDAGHFPFLDSPLEVYKIIDEYMYIFNEEKK